LHRLAEDDAGGSRRVGERHVGEMRGHGLDCRTGLQSRQLGAEAGVRAMGERHVRSRILTPELELVRPSERGRITIRSGQ
jgi:hypothetical protein